MQPPEGGRQWLALTERPIDVGAVHAWCVQPGCGAVVLFSGTVRDHAVEGEVTRDGVAALDYEAYDGPCQAVFAEIEAEARRRWPVVERIAIVHRVGRVGLGESSVVVAVGAPHRPEAFEAGRWVIDAVKASAPIWKHEQWSAGAGWGTGAAPVRRPHEVGR